MEYLIDEVCDTIHNYFPRKIHAGDFTIEDGEITCDFLKANDYFRIVGSAYNDGVWVYPVAGMIDETFTGEVWAMSVPPAFVAVCNEIGMWLEKYGSPEAMSPFQSESFNNYSYTRASNKDGKSVTWSDVFESRLARWRKLP